METPDRPLKQFNVLLMTATVVTVLGTDETSAAQTAVARAGDVIDAKSCRWVAKGVSLDEIHIAEPGETEADYLMVK